MRWTSKDAGDGNSLMFIECSLWARHWAKQINVAYHDHHKSNAATVPTFTEEKTEGQSVSNLPKVAAVRVPSSGSLVKGSS